MMFGWFLETRFHRFVCVWFWNRVFGSFGFVVDTGWRQSRRIRKLLLGGRENKLSFMSRKNQ
jgi:hypothetical protein